MTLNDIILNNRIPSLQNDTDVSNLPQATRNAAALELIDGLRAGDSLQAQIVGKDGNIVSMQLPNGAVVDARLTGNFGLEIGKLITFEVKSNGQNLSLSPLFTNLSNDPNITKAINMAGLPLNDSSAEMTKLMMQNGMNVDRNSLSAVYKDVVSNANASIINIVDLHRLGIEVNEDNLQQIDSYKNLSYKIDEGMTEISNGLKDLVNQLSADSNVNESGKIYNELIKLVLDSEDYFEDDILSFSSKNDVNENSLISDNREESLSNNVVNDPKEATNNLSAAEKALRLLSEVSEEKITQNGETETESIINKSNTEIPTKENILSELKNFADTNSLNGLSENSSLKELLNALGKQFEQAIAGKDTERISKLINNPTFRDAIFGSLEKEWSITPSQVSDKEKVTDLYNRLTKQLHQLDKILTDVGAKNTNVSNAVSNMSSNIDFLNQINQMYAYVQLPIRLSGGNNAHGDLYVYSNGKKLTGKEEKVSALLHLDMDNLGPVDVYVAMDNTGIQKRVSTQFYVSDDSILDFLNEHMDELTSRLEKKGYAISAKLSVKDKNELASEGLPDNDQGGIGGVLSQLGSVKLSEYAFDVRT